VKSALAKYEDTLEFATPMPVAKAVENVELRPSQIKSWLDELPRANPDLSAARVVGALENFHQQNLDDEQRLEALEAYRLPVASIVEELQAKFETQSIPLSPGTKESVDLAQSLITGMATGYMLVARNLVEQNESIISSDHKELAIQRSIYHLGQVLLNAYLTYRPAVRGVWADLYELYRYAEHDALLLEPIPMEGCGIVDSVTTIEASFQHILLVAAGDPAGLQMGECKRLYELLKRVQEEVNITTNLSFPDPVGIFVFDLTSDDPPLPLAATPDIHASPSLRSVDCLRPAKKLHGELKSRNRIHYANTSRMIDVSSLELLRRTGRKWAGNPARRQSVRSPQMLDLPVCSGIAGTHYYAYNQQPFSYFEQRCRGIEPEQEADAASNDEVFVDLNTPPDKGGWIQSTTASESSDADKSDDRVEIHDSTVAPRLHHLQIARVMDESAGGVRLRLFTGSMVRLMVGNIVAMQYGAGESWRIGMVRWLNASAKNYVDVGIMFLSPSMEPVAIQRLDADSEDPTLVPALLLPSNQTLGTPETIIVPRGTHNMGDELLIISEQGSIRSLKPMQLKERTSSFDQIVLDTVDEH